MTRVIVIGIDGMDKKLITKFEEELPTIKKIKEISPKIDMESVFPPDSETAWSSIYTGLNPAKHGVLHFLDPLEKSLINQTKDSDSEGIKSKTIWDIAGIYKQNVCILLPHIGYPVWPVNGIMIGRSSVKDDIQVYPANIANGHNLSNLNTIKGFPGKGGLSYDEYVKKHEKLLQSTLELGLELLDKENWNVFFIYSSILDVVPHFFWKFFDEEDPTYKDNPYKNVIKNLYISHDKFIEKFYSKLKDDDVLIIVSDHGHGRRPTKNVNINEVLRQKNLLLANNKSNVTIIAENFKRKALTIIGKYNLENYGSKVLKFAPKVRDAYTSPSTIDWKTTLAYVSNLSGIKSYYYGGIKVNKKLINNEEKYEKIRDEIIKLLFELSAPKTNIKLVRWAKRREELYQGPYIEQYPDVVFELLEDYGIGNRVKAPLIEDSPSHGIVPGSHKGGNAVFYIMGRKKEIRVEKKQMTLMDVAPTILDLLGIDWRRFDFDGKSVLEGGGVTNEH